VADCTRENESQKPLAFYEFLNHNNYIDNAAAPEIIMQVTVRKVKDAQPMGQYIPTIIDAAKKAVDFRLVDVSGVKNVIVWGDGRSERVTDKQLAKLQSIHSWATDF
jgi:hypothetical protein